MIDDFMNPDEGREGAQSRTRGKAKVYVEVARFETEDQLTEYLQGAGSCWRKYVFILFVGYVCVLGKQTHPEM
jgi:hypothetical protein